MLTFDSSGNLTTIEFDFNSVHVTRNVPDLTATSTVSGSNVTVTVSYAGPSRLTFTGTLDADDSTITGTLQYSLVIGATTITTGGGIPATLTKDP